MPPPNINIFEPAAASGVFLSAPSAGEGNRKPNGNATGNEHAHAQQKRVFIGPMPERVVAQASDTLVTGKGKRRRFLQSSSTENEDDDDILSRLMRDHAFAFFIKQGGQEEDWGEGREQSVREEMLRRWRETEWGAIRSRRRKRDPKEPRQQTRQWIGSSFEVGNILGVNILEAEPAESIRERLSNRSHRSTRPPGAGSSTTNLHSGTSAVGYERATSFYAAEPDNAGANALLRPPLSSSDSRRRVRSDYSPRPAPEVSAAPVQSDTLVPVTGAQRERAVHYARLPSRETREEDSPAPPSEVLERSPDEIPSTSAEAMLGPTPQRPEVPPGATVMRDRMLVRFGYSRDDSLGNVFDDEQSRKTRGIRYAEWAEFMVLWRNDQIQFYEQSNVPGTKWLTGSRYRLAFVVPLKSSKTRVSLYSFVDMTFCLICPPTSFHSSPGSKARDIFRRMKEGSNIFICKVKSRSRATDWLWQIWLELDGRIPPSIEVRNPSLGTRVRIDLSGKDSRDISSRENIIALCMRSLRRVKDWKELVELQLSEGKTLELAWRMGTQLDWVWLDDDVLGNPRSGSALYGLAIKLSSGFPQLEVRLAQHSSHHLILKTGTRLPEPPALEGYLERIRPTTQKKHPIYLVTHDGNLFALDPENANPPSPMGIGASYETAEALRRKEVKRGTLQVMKATGVSDLRSIVAVRRPFQPAVPAFHEEHEPPENQSYIFVPSRVQRTDSDDEDEGGEDVLRVAKDKSYLRMKRSFELLLTNGSVIRFEAHSRKVALEWIERLGELVVYWKQKHRSDAAEEMDLAQTYAPRLTPRRHLLRNDSDVAPEPPVDTSSPHPALGSLYSWCVLEGCKPIIRGGKVFMRQGLYGQYKFVHLFLLPGHLVQFQITPKSSLHMAIHKDINLADAYVTSGYFAALTLPDGQFAADSSLPRRYGDGLETKDSDEDTLFMLCYHPHRSAVNVALDVPEEEKQQTDSVPRIPSLASKRKIAVFRCRNRLERDAWCWALSCEIEKIVRIQSDREGKLRGTGGSFGQ